MNKQPSLQLKKMPLTCRLGRVGYAAEVIFRVLSLNVFDEDASSSRSAWTQNHGADAQTSLIPIRIPVSRRDVVP